MARTQAPTRGQGTEGKESRAAETRAVPPAHANDEFVACGGTNRRSTKTARYAGRNRRSAGARGRRRYVTDCWYTVKPIAAHTAATIQKRRMIFVSDHPRISKW
jgi:hypothetical protein